MKYKHREVNRDVWLKTASPFLIHRLNPKKQPAVYSKRGFKLTKNQIKAKERAERKKRRAERKLRRQKKRMPKYAVYILSKEWRAKCNAYYKKYGRKCVACGETKKIHMHHMNYINLGNEMFEDIVPLCIVCHISYHEKYGTKREMTLTTVEFIEDVRQHYGFPKFL